MSMRKQSIFLGICFLIAGISRSAMALESLTSNPPTFSGTFSIENLSKSRIKAGLSTVEPGETVSLSPVNVDNLANGVNKFTYKMDILNEDGSLLCNIHQDIQVSSSISLRTFGSISWARIIMWSTSIENEGGIQYQNFNSSDPSHCYISSQSNYKTLLNTKINATEKSASTFTSIIPVTVTGK